MFFLIRYQTVVASRRLSNFARQLFSKVTLVRMTPSSFARHFLQAGVFIICCASKISARNQNHTLPSRSAGREKILPSGPPSSFLTLALARANASGSFLGV